MQNLNVIPDTANRRRGFKIHKSKISNNPVNHPLHGHLKKIVVVKIPTEGGHFMQRMKLKTAIQKGHYSVNATNPKDKAAIEKALEHIKPSGDSHIDAMKDLQEIIAAKNPNI